MKKNPKEFTQLQKEFYETMKEKNLSEKLCHYVWDILISANKGYGFNASHTLSYSIVGLQEANLAYHYPIVYWNTANLISDSGGEDNTVKYDKIAAAVSRVRKEGISVIPPYINRAGFDFKPDAQRNEIVYGLKPIAGVGTSVAKAVIENGPYTSMWDFYNKMKDYKETSENGTFGDIAMIQLIKAGVFDEIENKSRVDIMKDFITFISEPLKEVKLSNIPELKKLGMLTKEELNKEYRLYRFRKYIFQRENIIGKLGKSDSTFLYKVSGYNSDQFFQENFASLMKENKDFFNDMNGNGLAVKKGSFDKVYLDLMFNFKEKINSDPKYLQALNDNRFNEIWNKRCMGSISKWEMDSLSYYYHDHELAMVDRKHYGIVNFEELSEEPDFVDVYVRGNREVKRFNLRKIAGTVLSKDKGHNTISLLTPDGVVTVRFYSGQFGYYDRDITETDENGNIKKTDPSWFKKGTMLLITGYRLGENFIPKKYNDSIYRHSVQLIKEVTDKNELILAPDRADVDLTKGIIHDN